MVDSKENCKFYLEVKGLKTSKEENYAAALGNDS